VSPTLPASGAADRRQSRSGPGTPARCRLCRSGWWASAWMGCGRWWVWTGRMRWPDA